MIGKKDRNNEDAQKCDIYLIICPYIKTQYFDWKNKQKTFKTLKLSVKSFF